MLPTADRFHNCGWLWPSKIIGLVPLHDFLQAFHRFGHHIGHFLRSVSTVRLRPTTSNPLSQSAIHDEHHAIDTLGSEEKMVCGRMFQANCWFCGWSEAFVQSPCLRTPQPGAPPALRCWLTTDWSQVPKFDGFRSLLHNDNDHCMQMNDQYITVNCDLWSMIKSNCLQPDPRQKEMIHSRD